MSTTSPCLVAPLIQAFFADHLLRHKNVSPRTVASYRDAFKLLLAFVHERSGTKPTALHVADLDAPLVLDFLEYLEQERRNTARSRNARLAAVRSFFRFVALREPECLAVATRVLAISNKRSERPIVGYLTRTEMDAILRAPDQSQWAGRRDYVLLLTMYNTGARVSEITFLRRQDITVDDEPHVHLHGKGRKERAIPLWARTARALRLWLDDQQTGSGASAFVSARRRRLTRHGVDFLLKRAVACASAQQPSLAAKRVSPHTIRHTTAMHLLQSGVDPSVIALWLGHESIETTHVYMQADMAMKQAALDKLSPTETGGALYEPDDALMTFLAAL